MVGTVEDQRVVRLAAPGERAEDAGEELVEIGAVGPEVADALPVLALRKLAEDLIAHAPVDAGLVVEPIGVAGGQRNVGEPVAVQMPRGREVGVVRADQPDIQAPGIAARLPSVDRLDGSRDRLLVMVFGALGRPRAVQHGAAVAGPQDSALAALDRLRLGGELPVVVPARAVYRAGRGADESLGPAARRRRLIHADMPFSREIERVAGRGQVLAPEAHAGLGAPAQSLVVADIVPYAVAGRVQAGEERGPRGTAVGGGTEGVGEGHALRREAREGGSDRRVLGQNRVAPLVIGHEDEDVGFAHGGGISQCGRPNT